MAPDRRLALFLIGVSLALAGLAGQDASAIGPTATYDLYSENLDPRGIAADDSSFYVVDEGTDMVYIYSKADGSYQSSFPLHASNTDPAGIYVGTDLLGVLDKGDKFYTYQKDGPFQIDIAGSSLGEGTSFDDGKIYYRDTATNTLIEYVNATTSNNLGALTTPTNWPISGLEVNGDIVYTVSHFDDMLRVYSKSDIAAGSVEFELADSDSNIAPHGISSDADNVYVVRDHDHRIYVYSRSILLPPDGTTITSPSAGQTHNHPLILVKGTSDSGSVTLSVDDVLRREIGTGSDGSWQTTLFIGFENKSYKIRANSASVDISIPNLKHSSGDNTFDVFPAVYPMSVGEEGIQCIDSASPSDSIIQTKYNITTFSFHIVDPVISDTCVNNAGVLQQVYAVLFEVDSDGEHTDSVVIASVKKSGDLTDLPVEPGKYYKAYAVYHVYDPPGEPGIDWLFYRTQFFNTHPIEDLAADWPTETRVDVSWDFERHGEGTSYGLELLEVGTGPVEEVSGVTDRTHPFTGLDGTKNYEVVVQAYYSDEDYPDTDYTAAQVRTGTPPAPVITTPSQTNLNFTTFDVEGTTVEGTEVQVHYGAAEPTHAIVDGISWAVQIELPNLHNQIYATATYDNDRTSGHSNIITANGRTPEAPSILNPAGELVYTPLHTIYGTSESLNTVTVYVDGEEQDPVPASPGGTWVGIYPLSVGNNTIHAKASNGFGTSPKSGDVTITYEVSPILLDKIGDIEMTVGDPPYVITFSDHFTDEDDEHLEYEVSTDPDGIVSISENDITLALTAMADGTTQVTVTATDHASNSVSDDFMVTVNPAPEDPETEPEEPDHEHEAHDPTLDDIGDRAMTVGEQIKISIFDYVTHNDTEPVAVALYNHDDDVASVAINSTEGSFTITGLSQGTATMILAAFHLDHDEQDIQTTTFDVTVDRAGGGDGDDAWQRKPTFGVSWETYAQLIHGGFTFNGIPLTITDNWHTEFTKTSSIIGTSNTVKIKSYTPEIFSTVTLSLGVPEIGMAHKSETDIILAVQKNNTSPTHYDLVEIVHEQDEELVETNSTSASAEQILCSPGDEVRQCHMFTIHFSINAPLSYDVLAISAMTDKRRTTTTYINEGVEFTGDSLLAPETDSVFVKDASQDPGTHMELTKQDRRYDVWVDPDGNLWLQNAHGTFIRLTHSLPEQRQDDPALVMTRTHSGFGQMLEQERERALGHFDSSLIQAELGGTFAYEYPGPLEKLEDPDVILRLMQQERLAIEYLTLLGYD